MKAAMRAGDQTKQVLRPDLCVLGGGACGLAVATGAVALGFSVVLIEKGPMGGHGLSSEAPRQVLGAIAKRLGEAGRAQPFLRDAVGLPDAAAVFAHIKATVASLARDASRARFEALGVRVIAAAGRFTGHDQVTAGGFLVESRRFVIATGSVPVVPSIPGIELVRSLTPDTVFELSEMPERLVILGNDAAAVELAQGFARLQCGVSLIASGRLLGDMDGELVAILGDELRLDGVDVREGVSIERIEPKGSGVQIFASGALLAEGSHLLISVGRKPQLEGLGLEAGGVVFDASGIRVGSDLRNPGNRGVFAVGDCAFPTQAAAPADHLAGLLLRSVLRVPKRLDTQFFAPIVYADPEFASVGLGEEAARARHGHIHVLRWPFAANDRARIESKTAGHVKVIASKTGTILGAGILGEGAGELIMPWCLAISRGLDLATMAALPVPRATRSAAGWRAAASFALAGSRKPWLGRILDLARRWG